MGSSGGSGSRGSDTIVIEQEPAIVAAVQKDVSGSYAQSRMSDQQKQRSRLRGIRSTWADQNSAKAGTKSALGE